MAFPSLLCNHKPLKFKKKALVLKISKLQTQTWRSSKQPKIREAEEKNMPEKWRIKNGINLVKII
jgi:hypothetical protein